MSADEHDLLTIKEVADILRTSRSAVNRSIAAGTFPVPVFRPTPRKALVSRDLLYQAITTGAA